MPISSTFCSLQLLAVVLLLAPHAVSGAQISTDNYIENVKSSLEKLWRPRRSKMLSIIKVKLSIDKGGQIHDLEFITGANGKDCESLTELIRTTHFQPLPGKISSLNLGLSFGYGSDIKSLSISNLDERIRIVTAATSNQETAKFVSAVEKRIKSFWHLDDKFRNGNCVVRFTIEADGQLTELVLLKPDKRKEFNKAALAAVKNAAPFVPVSPNITLPVEIEFTFDNFLADSPPTPDIAAL